MTATQPVTPSDRAQRLMRAVCASKAAGRPVLSGTRAIDVMSASTELLQRGLVIDRRDGKPELTAAGRRYRDRHGLPGAGR